MPIPKGRSSAAGSSPRLNRLNSRDFTKIEGREQRERHCSLEEIVMTWSTPVLIEICVGLEINGYLPAEF
jgi:coenzyme PQQ precursor peptide PqqA